MTIPLSKLRVLAKTLNGPIGLDYNCGGLLGLNPYHIVCGNSIILSFATIKEQLKHFHKLVYDCKVPRVWNTSSDEVDGICQSAELGENPFTFTIMSR